jgi:hypothetical protein
MTALYGNYDSSAGLSRVTSPSDSSEDRDVRAFFVAATPDTGTKEVLLATFAVLHEGEEKCHTCSPDIGGAVVRKDASGWIVEASAQPADLFVSADGELPDASLVQFGPHQYGIKLEYSGEHGSRAYTETSFFLPWAGRFTIAVSKTTIEDSSEDGRGCGRPHSHSVDGSQLPCYAYHKKLTFTPGRNPEYFDLMITTTGTDLNQSGEVIDVTGTENLHFIDGEYR